MHFFLLGIIFLFGQMEATGEKVPFSLLLRLLPSNPTIIEAGAQFGEDTAWMSEVWKEGTIYAFEPNPPSYEELEKVANSRKNIFIEKLALSDKIGTFNFYQAGGASSLLKPTQSFNDVYFHSDLEHPIVVETTTLDTWAKNKGVNFIDFLWLDMEGNELNALKGAPEMLKTVKVIYTEVNLQNFWEGCVRYPELEKWLKQNGFIKIWEDIVPGWHGNVLFVRSD